MMGMCEPETIYDEDEQTKEHDKKTLKDFVT